MQSRAPDGGWFDRGLICSVWKLLVALLSPSYLQLLNDVLVVPGVAGSAGSGGAGQGLVVGIGAGQRVER